MFDELRERALAICEAAGSPGHALVRETPAKYQTRKNEK
jgi:hypothetical protein